MRAYEERSITSEPNPGDEPIAMLQVRYGFRCKTNGGGSPLTTSSPSTPRVLKVSAVSSPTGAAAQSQQSAGGGNSEDGTYKQWRPNDPISQQDIKSVTGNWVGSSSNVRHAIQGDPDKKSGVTVKQAQQYDDWLNSGSYSGTIYRGKGVEPDVHQAILAMKPGDMIGQDGPASFSKSEKVALKFADGGYSPYSHNQRVVFVLEKGTNCGRDISTSGGLGHEKEVIVGSASKIILTKPVETKVIGGKHFTYVYGVEMKTQYTPSKKQP
jgi:hypothetical protein